MLVRERIPAPAAAPRRPATRMLSASALAVLLAGASPASGQGAMIPWMQDSSTRLEQELVEKHGEVQRPRLQRGLRQVAGFWRAEDGDAAVFEAFVRTHFAGDQASLDSTFERFERLLEQMDGHLNEIGRELRAQSELDLGPTLPVDEIFAAYSPSAHLNDDFFENKLAFVVLLNFPLTTLEQRLAEGAGWSRRQWAEARLAQRFSKRVPADVELAFSEAIARASQYIARYNIWMHHVVDDKGRRLFPAKMRLLSHWNLRDQIKADYGDTRNGLAKQRAIQQVMERIVTQTIPEVVIDNPDVDWNPFTNTVKPAAVRDADRPATGAGKPSGAPEPDTRYATILGTFAAARLADPYSPTAPTVIQRSFEEGREIPEARVRAILEQVVSSPLVPQVARLIEARLGRKLEPFDIWYNGFKPRGAHDEAGLDAITARKYPTPKDYEADMPRLLTELGFAPARAAQLAANIVVDPARGSGHALGATMRAAKSRLRTRVEPGGMNYKGYNIAVHEMGHNVEQTLSLNDIDHWLLHGVPNNAFTEALAFVFQAKDLELLGLARPDDQAQALKALNDFWATYEIGGVALVDMAMWHWMYEHPQATPAELKAATVDLAKDVWNRWYAPVFGRKDVVLLGVYSHMVEYPLYLPDYPIGHLIAFQIEQQMEKAGHIGPEFERMCKAGSIAPDLWMKNATGAPVGPEALLEAAEKALAVLGAKRM
jgi:hypothetical protein